MVSLIWPLLSETVCRLYKQMFTSFAISAAINNPPARTAKDMPTFNPVVSTELVSVEFESAK